MKFSPSCDDICHSFDMVDLTIHDHVLEALPKDQLDSFLFEPIKDCQPRKDINLWEDDSEIAIDEEKLQNSLDSLTTPGLFSYLEPEYAFLDGNQEFPVIISSLLSHQEKDLLLQVLSKHKSALAWKVADMKDWNLDFELMCDASDYAVGAVCKVEALLQEFTIKIKDEKGTENLAADHLSRLEIPDLEELDEEAI
ncbi:hypothetical protein Tco_1310076 [Tanacetum coccineum]